MTNKISKACPFCYLSPYIYKTQNGLIRHVMKLHLADSNGRIVSPPFQHAEKIRKETMRGVTLIEIDSWKEVEEFLIDYWKGYKNPSLKCSRLWNYVDS